MNTPTHVLPLDTSCALQKKFKSSKNIVTLFASTSRPNAQGNFTEFLLLMELCPGVPLDFECCRVCQQRITVVFSIPASTRRPCRPPTHVHSSTSFEATNSVCLALMFLSKPLPGIFSLCFVVSRETPHVTLLSLVPNRWALDRLDAAPYVTPTDRNRGLGNIRAGVRRALPTSRIKPPYYSP